MNKTILYFQLKYVYYYTTTNTTNAPLACLITCQIKKMHFHT